MPLFHYAAIDRSGSERTGTVRAATIEAANRRLGARQLMPVQLELAPANAHAGERFIRQLRLPLGRSVRDAQLTGFVRQLAILIRARLPLLRALEVLTRQQRNRRFAAALEVVAEEVRSGNSFAGGLEQHPWIFDRLCVDMVRAGEAGGVLDVVLGRLADFKEKSLRTRKKVLSALVYPLVVVGVAISIVALLMIVVVPRFEVIFDDLLEGAALPAATQLVISCSRFLGSNGLLPVLLLLSTVVVLSLFKRARFAAHAWDWCAIKLPLTGDLVRKSLLARITRTFGTLLSSGVPILEALAIAGEVGGNRIYSRSLMRVAGAVRDGEPLAAPLQRDPLFPGMVSSMIEVGEETGDLAGMLERIADACDEEVDYAVAGITSVIEPVMIVFLALVVGFIVIALFLPIVEIIRQLTG